MPWPRPIAASLALSLALPLAVAAAKPGKKSGDATPVLVSTEGGGWKSIAHLQEAAGKGDPKACYDLALLCLEGSSDIKQDVPRALALYEQAARGGIHDAWFRLGKIHHDGVGVESNRGRGFLYFLEAAKRGVPEAQYNVGAMLASGRGVRRDFVEGLAWLIVASKSGADGGGEAQLRERLSRRPADIAAAEQRAAGILQALKDGGEPVAQTGPTAPTPPPSAVPSPVRPKMEPPTIKPDTTAPKVDITVTPLPPPVMPPKR